ncbi:delta(1)-pyrroline-2-carboxylate reductase family protein [Burkholderia alba]|uniref:delta(1)-pyrroline-2-carboxylate reductase family protein n=1 Tax=Burkholderia alba TaxID=2683677 RepID=UPI002B05412F|nr:delta(1)-pyrroline-2-carboxylate reductase family protein [Burkholderia alba]
MAMAVLDATQTAALTPFAALVEALAAAAQEAAQGGIVSPARRSVPLNEGGVMLSMPASASDIAIHKLVTVCPRNRAHGQPTIQGQVSVHDPASGATLFALDGPTVTGRRTAAVTLLAIRTLLPAAPRDVLLYGAGTQAAHHVAALGALFPGVRVWVGAHSAAQAAAFCAARRSVPALLAPFDPAKPPAALDVVIAATTSKTPVYDEAGRAGRLVIGVGAFTPDAAEIGARTVADSALFVDDPQGARHEAGDLIQAEVDWGRVGSLAEALRDGRGRAADEPVLFKSVGCAAWDLAAGRVALTSRTRGCT